jgi:hypothetical protein
MRLLALVAVAATGCTLIYGDRHHTSQGSGGPGDLGGGIAADLGGGVTRDFATGADAAPSADLGAVDDAASGCPGGCPTPPGAESATCDGTQCTVTCMPGLMTSGASCVSRWKPLPSGGPSFPDGLWGTGPSALYVTGNSSFYQYDGMGHWTQLLNFGPWTSVGGSSATDFYVVGDGIQHFTSSASAESTGVSKSYFSVWGGGGQAYIAASARAVFHKTTPTGSWVQETPPASAESANDWYYAVWGSSASDVYVAGNNVILHSTGNGTWTIERDRAGATFRGLGGSAWNDLYAVGDGGLILHSVGNNTWAQQPSGTTNNLLAVWAASISSIYAVGERDTVLHSTGTGSWTPMPTLGAGFIRGVWGSSDSDVYLAGTAQVLHGP